MRMLILPYTIQEVVPNVYTKFKILGAVVPEKSSIGAKEKWTIKKMISMRMLILCYTIQQATPNVFSKFQNPW